MFRVVQANRVLEITCDGRKIPGSSLRSSPATPKESFALSTTTSSDSHVCDNLSIDTPRLVALDPTPVSHSARSPGHEGNFPMASTGVNVRLFLLAMERPALNRCGVFYFFIQIIYSRAYANLLSLAGPTVLSTRCWHILRVVPPSKALISCKARCDQQRIRAQATID
jgi:hypothetical protein